MQNTSCKLSTEKIHRHIIRSAHPCVDVFFQLDDSPWPQLNKTFPINIPATLVVVGLPELIDPPSILTQNPFSHDTVFSRLLSATATRRVVSPHICGCFERFVCDDDDKHMYCDNDSRTLSAFVTSQIRYLLNEA